MSSSVRPTAIRHGPDEVPVQFVFSTSRTKYTFLYTLIGCLLLRSDHSIFADSFRPESNLSGNTSEPSRRCVSKKDRLQLLSRPTRTLPSSAPGDKSFVVPQCESFAAFLTARGERRLAPRHVTRRVDHR